MNEVGMNVFNKFFYLFVYLYRLIFSFPAAADGLDSLSWFLGAWLAEDDEVIRLESWQQVCHSN
jgi:hypothetical protein